MSYFNCELNPSDVVFRRLHKIAKTTMSFVTSVCPSVLPSIRSEQLGSHSTDFY
jgi:hypothetical protein